MGLTRWQIAQDAALAGVISAAGLAEAWVPFASVQGDGSAAVSTVGVVVGGAALAVRRRWPLALVAIPAVWLVIGAATMGGLQVLFYGQLVALSVATYSAARHGDRRTVVVVCGAIAATVLVADFTVPAFDTLNEIVFHWGVLSGMFAVGFGLRRSEARAVSAAVKAAEAEASAREAAILGASRERVRIARDLHDIVGHAISSIIVQAGAASTAVEDDPAVVRRSLDAIRATGVEAMADMRRVVAALRDQDSLATDAWDADGDGGLGAVMARIDQARADGLHVELVQHGRPTSLTALQQAAIARIVQESLTNVRKHAPTTEVTVEVEWVLGGAEVSVANRGALGTHDGSGTRQAGGAEHARGTGLVGMRERVEECGGTLEAGPVADGWRVHARLAASP